MILRRQNAAFTAKDESGAWVLVVSLSVAVSFGIATALVGGVISGLLLVSLTASVAALANYRVGIWFLVLLLPLSATTVFPHQVLGITGANPYNALFVLTLVSFLGTKLLRGTTGGAMAYPRLWWAYVLPLVAAALVGSQHISEIPEFAYASELIRFTSASGYFRDALVKPLTYVILALLLGAAVRDGMKPGNIVSAFCLSIWLLAAWVIAYVLLSGVGLDQMSSNSARGLLTRTGMHANGLGAFAAFALTVMIFSIANPDRNAGLRGLYIATAFVSGTLLVISFSRGGFLAFAAGLAFFFILQRRVRVIVIALLSLAFILPLLPAEFYDRLTVGFGTGGSMVMYSRDDPLTAGRVAGIWMPLLSEVRAHPLFGNGLLAVAWSMPFRSGALVMETLNPHSMYLKILLELGVVGFALVAFFFVDLWKRFRSAAIDVATPSQLAWFFQGAAAALVGHGVFGVSGGDYLPNPSNALLWVVLGLLLAVPGGRSRIIKARELRTLSPQRGGPACDC